MLLKLIGNKKYFILLFYYFITRYLKSIHSLVKCTNLNRLNRGEVGVKLKLPIDGVILQKQTAC